MPDLELVGFAVMIIGILIVALSALSSERPDSKIAIGGVIGFIPFGFSNNPQLAKLVFAVSVVIAVAFIILFLKGLLL